MASQGYPGEYLRGKKIPGLTESNGEDTVKVFHPGTRKGNDGCIKTTGGRVFRHPGRCVLRLSALTMIRADCEPTNVARKTAGKVLSTVRISPCSEKRAGPG